MSKRHFPSKGDKVNDTRRKAPYQNGFVLKVIFDDGPEEVLVDFDNEKSVAYDYDEFRYTWTEKYGGCFILEPNRSRHV